MKKLIFMAVAIISIVSFAKAQDSLYFCKGGLLVNKFAIGKVDSISIHPDGVIPSTKKLMVSTLCGTGVGTMTNGTLAEASLLLPFRLTIDNTGALYVVEENTNIRKVDPNADQVYSVYYPDGVFVGRMTAICMSVSQDTIFVSRDQLDDVTGNGLGIYTLRSASNYNYPARYSGSYSTNTMAVNPVTGEVFCNRFIGAKVIRINQITNQDEEMFHAGSKDADEFRLAWSQDGKTLYTASYYNAVVWKSTYDLVTKTFVGSPTLFVGAYEQTGIVEGFGPAARMQSPAGLATDKLGNLYICDNRAHCILKVNSNGYLSLLAGNPGISGIQDGEASISLFSEPESVVVDKAKNIVYVADRLNHRIRKIAIQ